MVHYKFLITILTYKHTFAATKTKHDQAIPTMPDGFSLDWRLSEAGRNKNSAVAITSHPIIIIIIMLKPPPASSPFGPGTATTHQTGCYNTASLTLHCCCPLWTELRILIMGKYQHAQVSPLTPNSARPIHGSIGPQEFTSRTASWPVQLFLQGSYLWPTKRQTQADHSTV